MRALAFVLLIAAPVALAAPVPKELKKKNDLERVVGAWTQLPNGGIWKFEADGGAAIGGTAGIKYAIDFAAEPTTFDWIAPWGKWYGVCEFKDETFTIYLRPERDNKGRNLELKASPGVEVYSFKRAGSDK